MSVNVPTALLCVCAVLLCGCALGPKGTPLGDLLPDEADGWRPAAEERVYRDEELFDYIDGAAEPYLHYGFRSVAARRYEREGQPAITVDLFDMGTSENAFGIFSFEREGRDVGVGQGSECEAGMMRFWKGRYFASILAEGEGPEVRGAVFSLARAVDAAIEETGPPPDLPGLLPKEHLLEDKVRYLRHLPLLNYHYYVSDQDILHLGDGAEAALGTYAWDDGRMRLLVVRYATRAEAQAALDDFLRAYAPEAGAEGAVQTEDGKWTVARCRGALLTVAFDAPTRERGQGIVDSVSQPQEGP